jgi:hypothetical protein
MSVSPIHSTSGSKKHEFPRANTRLPIRSDLKKGRSSFVNATNRRVRRCGLSTNACASTSRAAIDEPFIVRSGRALRAIVVCGGRVDGVFHINSAFAPHEADTGVAIVEAAKVVHPWISKMTKTIRQSYR